MMEFRRERMDIGWKLVPSMITVKPLEDMFWTIYLGDCPINARYSSE